MNTSGEVADLMVKEGIQITESGAKLAGLGAKNLAAIIITLINDETKLQGKTNLKQLLKSEKPLCILQINEKDLKEFNSEAKKYGVLFTAVFDKANNTGFCDIIAKQDDVTKLNYIMEKLDYAAPDIDIEPENDNLEKSDKCMEEQLKNHNPRMESKENLHENKYMAYGDMERTDSDISSKSSIRKKIEEIKYKRKQDQTEKVPKKQKYKNKGKSR